MQSSLILSFVYILEQGKDLSEPELQSIVAAHDLDRNGVFDEVLEC
jgi:hypothetical protein